MSERTRYADIPDPPKADFEAIVKTYEGGFQNLANDWGNWTGGRPNIGWRIGTNRGVTVGTFMRWRGIDAAATTPARLQAALKMLGHEEAIEIAWNFYFVDPGFHRLPYSRLVEFFFDWGWGSGQFTAVRALQRLVGVMDDGVIGPVTVAAYSAFVALHGLPEALEQAIDARVATAVGDDRPGQDGFKAGWIERYEAFSFQNRPDGAPPPPFRGGGFHYPARKRPAPRSLAGDPHPAPAGPKPVIPAPTAVPRPSWFARLLAWLFGGGAR